MSTQAVKLYDEAHVQLRLAGDRSGHITQADRFEIVRRARARGWSYNRIINVTGIGKPQRYLSPDERGPLGAPRTLVMTPAGPSLPAMDELANALRDGHRLDQLCSAYVVSERYLTELLRIAGYEADGTRIERRPAPRSVKASDSGYGTGYAYNTGNSGVPDLPYAPVRYGARKPRPTGLDWDALRPADEVASTAPANVWRYGTHTFATEAYDEELRSLVTQETEQRGASR